MPFDIDQVLTFVLSWLPLLAVVVVGGALIAGARYLLLTRGDAAHSERRIFRQLWLLAIVLVVMVAGIITLPVDSSVRGQLLSFFGLLLSAMIALSSTTFVGNAMAGLMLRTVRSIRPGDFIKVGEEFGRISEFGLLHTEIQTEERTLTTLPNLHLVTNPVNVVRTSGTVVAATVSLGYDVPRSAVIEALKNAATEADLTDPFVHVMELRDFAVTYRISGVLAEVKQLISARSRLREQMLDALHEAGIEIVSPTFMNQRQLKPGHEFIPQPNEIPETVERAPEERSPEEIIFDKADQAETASELELRIEELRERLGALKESNADPDTAKAKAERINSLIQRLQERISKLHESPPTG